MGHPGPGELDCSDFLWGAERPLFQISRRSQDAKLAALEFEHYILQSDEVLAGLRIGGVEIVNGGRAGVYAGFDRIQILLSNFVFQFSHVARSLHLSDGALQTQSFFRDLVASGLRLLGCFDRVGVGSLGAGSLRKVQKRKANGDSNRGVILAKAAVRTQKRTETRSAGFFGNVVVLKIIEVRKQGVLAGEIEGRPEGAVLAVG